VVTALAERGISLAGVAPKPITAELLANAGLVITMSRHPTGPSLPDIATHQQHWQLDFPGDDLKRCGPSATKLTARAGSAC
jgi:protein-tyrosine-phosphatase